MNINILQNINILLNCVLISNKLSVDLNDRLPIIEDVVFYETERKSKSGKTIWINKHAKYEELPQEIKKEIDNIHKKNISEYVSEQDIVWAIERINRKVLVYVKTLDSIKNMHKLENLIFDKLDMFQFKNIQKLKIYKSPVYHGRQSSEYYVGILNGDLIYIRKSNHWGEFKTNKYTNPDDENFDSSDIYFRKDYNYYNWQLVNGLKNKDNEYSKISQVGYIKCSMDKIKLMLRGKYE